MESQTLTATSRSSIGTHCCRKLRDRGQVPGIIYGHGEAPQAFSVDRHDLEVQLGRGHHVLALDLDAQTRSYLVKDVQYDPLGTHVVHVDLARIDLHEKVRLKIAVELRGTPQGTTEGGVLDQLLNELEIECLASAIPHEIRATVGHLGVNQSLTVGDLQLPDGVVPTLNADTVIATVRVIAEELAPEEAEEAEATEPEIISRGKEEKAGEESDS